MVFRILTKGRSRKAHSASIDKQFEEDCRRFRNSQALILLLGVTGLFIVGSRLRTYLAALGVKGCGMSTQVKQMKIIHANGFSHSELAEYRPVVYENVLDSMHRIIVYMRKVGLEFVIESNFVCFLSPISFRVIFFTFSRDTDPCRASFEIST